jgi:hypothetical protein
MGNSKGFPTSHHMQDSDTFCKSYDIFFFFFLNEGMLSATAVAAEFAQNCPKQCETVKICPKTISLRNFEIPPKIEILIFFKKNPVCRGRTKAYSHHLDFQYNNFLYAFFIVKKQPLYVNFNIPPCGK